MLVFGAIFIGRFSVYLPKADVKSGFCYLTLSPLSSSNPPCCKRGAAEVLLQDAHTNSSSVFPFARWEVTQPHYSTKQISIVHPQ